MGEKSCEKCVMCGRLDIADLQDDVVEISGYFGDVIITQIVCGPCYRTYYDNEADPRPEADRDG